MTAIPFTHLLFNQWFFSNQCTWCAADSRSNYPKLGPSFGVSVHRRRGTPWSLVPGSFPGLWSQVLSEGSCPRGYPSHITGPVWKGGYPSPVAGPAREVPQPRTGVNSLPGLGYLSPARAGVPSPTTQNQYSCAVHAVCLLYSHRRTFLFVK